MYWFTKDLLSLALVSHHCTFKGFITNVFLFCFQDTGAQPLVSDDGKIILAVNGEIYNHIALRESVGPDVKFKTHSDCEVIIPLVCCNVVMVYGYV